MLGTIGKGLSLVGGKVNPFARKAVQSLANMPSEGKYNLALRVFPDIAFAGLETYLNPGDAVEKGLAGIGSGGGSLAGGIALSKLAGKNQALGTLLDMVGSIGGDMGGRYLSDIASRGYDRLKGGEGLTAYERMGAEQQKQFKKEVQSQLLAELGLLPSSTQQFLLNQNNIG
tara:strand:- start:137 stop:652 length:516 start_codon:yes stop_codon:yes gene_type:complete